ncbi:MAG: copper amine oxidase N-terminal domain-containing protein [Tissierellia bacterium]|nr:copper amine oxidase N-terminal domain-containing protein [Tissierellia bacterium]
MDRVKKYLALALVACISLSPLVIKAEDNQPKELVPIDGPIYQVEQADYIRYDGKIADIKEDEKLFSIWVTDDEEDPYSGMVLYITEDTILLRDETNDFMPKDELELGMEVTSYYHKDTIMLMTAPPRLGADIIMVRDSEEEDLIHVSKFNEELISSDKSLKLKLSEDTVMVDKDGNTIGKEDIINRDLIVFYTLVAESLPAQATPNKIILVEKDDGELEVRFLDKVMIDEKEISLNNPIYKNDQDIFMLPLRQIAETLGYQVEWINESRTVKLTKEDYRVSLPIGEKSYKINDKPLRLGIAAELKNSTTYVAIDFLKETMAVDIEVLETGMFNIIKQ